MSPTNRKVLMLLTNAFDPDPRVYKEARSLVKSGYNVTILCWDRDLKAKPREVIDGIEVERIYVRSSHARGSAQMFFLILFWIKAFLRALPMKFDVVHCHDFDTLPLGYVLKEFRKAKLVYDSHESYVDMLSNLPHLMKKCIYLFENCLLKTCSLVVTVGEILKRYLEARGARKVCVVGNWKDPGDFRFSDEALKQEKKRLGVNNGQLIVSFIANLGPERQLSQLLEAVEAMPGVFLIVGGDGPSRPLVEEAARDFPNITYLGYVYPTKIPLYTSLSDAIFYGFDPANPNARFSAPNKLFEALAAGKPVITADFGEIGRIVKERECGIILNDYSVSSITDALKMLHTNGGRIFRANATAAGREYNWQNAEDVLIKAYQSNA